MAELLMMAGFLGGIGCIVWFIVRLFKRKPKKPAGLGIVLCFVALVAGGALYAPESTESRSAPLSGEPVEAELPASQSTVGQNTIPEASPSASQASQIRQDGAVTYKLPNGAELDFYDSVPGDVTGRWRVAVTSSSTSPSNYAVDYYNNVFSSDDEIHAICDPALGTTTRLMVNAGLLFVDTLKYVDGEERDAKLLFSGDVVRSKILDKETGRPVELEQTEESPSPSTAPSQSPSPSVAPSPSVSPPPASAAPSVRPTPTPSDKPSEIQAPASPVQSSPPQATAGNSGDRASKFANGMVLATIESDNGGDPVYHTKDCRAAQKIDTGSELWYESAQAAERDNRRICGNCKR